MRVVFDRTTLAKIHACTGPLFFALATAYAVVTSPSWRAAPLPIERRAERWGRQVALASGLLTLLIYAQIVIGAQVRHIAVDTDPAWWQSNVWFHVIQAGLILGCELMLAGQLWRGLKHEPSFRRPAVFLTLLVICQLALGIATWLVKYGWPAAFSRPAWSEGLLVQQMSRWQVGMTTAHVAIGSLLLVTSLAVALRCGRRFRGAFGLSPAWNLEAAS
jgi:cytochrome c oxidase assembly protein subunit 15